MGRAGMDLYADPPGTAIADAARFTSALGGSSANIAAGLSRQGIPTALLTCVSDDSVGRFALSQLDLYRIGRRHVRIVGGDARTSLAVVDTNGDATEAVIYRNGPADLEMTQEDVAAVDWNDHDALVTTGTVLTAEPSRSAALEALSAASTLGKTAILDIDYRPYNWPSLADAQAVFARAAEAAHIVVGNDVEFGVVAGGPAEGLEAARDLAAAGKVVIYKQGGAGAVVLADGRETSFGVFDVAALKPTGAGDAFLAGFLATLAAGGLARPGREPWRRGRRHRRHPYRLRARHAHPWRNRRLSGRPPLADKGLNQCISRPSTTGTKPSCLREMTPFRSTISTS